MAERPKIKLALTTADKIFEFAGWLLIFVSWLLSITHYTDLPNTIPIHFNAAGQADGFGGKGTIFTLPLVATILFIGLTVLNQFPHVFNYATDINKENAKKQYINSTRMIRYLKFIVAFILGLISWQTIKIAKGESEGLGDYFMVITLGLIFIPMFYFMIRSYKIK
jgi:uncharacterized membrane protein